MKPNVSEIIVDNVHISDSGDISNKFNSYFSNVGKNIANQMNSGPRDHIKYLSGNYRSSFYFSPVSTSQVFNCIYNLKNKKCGLFSIPVRVLKHINCIIAPVIASIINKSIEQGVFPDSLKVACVIPLFKSGEKSLLGNYRPISLLPIFSKIFERLAHDRLYDYLLNKNIIFPHQYGFQKNKSTTDAILKYLTYVYDSLDRDFFVFSLFLDFKKAFDTVDHEILLSKLYHYGIRGVAQDWIRSYLTNRVQYVLLNNVKSQILPVTTGVPQGSIYRTPFILSFYKRLA